MVKGIYVVRDNLAQCALGGPMIFAHDAVAVRFFGDLIKDERSAIAKYPLDHSLLRIGTFDEETSIIVPQEVISVVITGEAWLAVNAPNPEGPTS